MNRSPTSLVRRFGRIWISAARQMLARARYWAPMMLTFMATQAAVQGCGLLTGIVIIRSLTKADYAYYTLAASGLAALSVLSNSGISYGVTAIGGRVWHDPAKLGSVVATALQLRRRIGLLAAMPTAAVLLFLLFQNGASPSLAATLVALVVAAAFLQLTYGILLVVLQLQGRIRSIQYLDLGAGLLRLALTAGAAAVFINAEIGLLIGAVIAFAQLFGVGHYARGSIEMQALPDLSVGAEIKAIVRRQWLNEIYYVFQGQLYVLLLGFFGTPESIADFGALTRINIVFSLIGSVMSTIVLPRYARQPESSRLKRLHAAIFSAYLCAVAAPVVLVWLSSRQILWVFGAKYYGLDLQLVMVTASAALAALAGAAWSMNANRGWIVPGWIAISAGLGAQIAIMAAIGTSTFFQVVTVGILSNAAFLTINLAATVVFLRRIARRVT